MLSYWDTWNVGKGKSHWNSRGVSHWGLAIYIKKVHILGQKKNYENSNISPMQKYNLQKIL
jgi:hypothetical protein